ncbi:hypothetical protein VE01_02496 [Pseudogymnoascus verrucosus]|uniref:Store-operated calcium entry-associated regulatory factor n=1 Tax=Pseudogymnoascus verrucosus TaxID=342668 RepID=A0A1B8GT45_9PEZI|nr:uncharacterized protein VE01_02496 [Pseudogymnoascus verrucosus]OBT99012.1 hypothetical protein VE01_02496 [Pseudogymnoascus verrucosus]
MHILPHLTPLLLALLTLTPPATAARKSGTSVLLSQVKSLTLRSTASTAHRRVPAIPQLKCMGGNGCRHHQVDVMRCKNAGSDYDDENIQWTCTADLPEEFKLGSTDVICEGYDGPEDPRVLKGSCGVEYRLLLTKRGEEVYGGGGHNVFSGQDGDVSGAAQVVFWAIFLGVAAWIVYSIWKNWGTEPAAPRREPRRDGFWGGGGGGGGGGGDYPTDPPPPYPGTGKSSSGQEGWRPGFWTGAAGGAAAGYMAGSRGNRQQENRGARGWFGGDRQQEPRGGGGWMGGGGNGYNYGGPSRSSSGGSSSSGARHESTGFGSTTRR